MKINRIVFIIVVTLFLVLNLTSCNQNISVENRDFADTVGVDYVGDEIKVTLLIPDPSKVAKGEKDVNQVVSATAKTFTEAIKKADGQSANKLSLENLRVILLGEDLAKDDKALSLIFDAVKRNSIVSKRVIIGVAKGDASTVLNEKIKNAPIFGKYLIDYYNQSPHDIYIAYDKKLGQLISKNNLVHSIILPQIYVENGKLNLEEGVLFSEGEYKGTFDNETLKGYALVDENINNFITVVDYKGEKVPITVKAQKNKIKFSEGDGKVTIDLTQSYDCILTEFRGQVSSVDLEELTKLFNEEIKSDINNAYEYFSVQHNSDIYGFEDMLKKDNYNLYQKYTNNALEHQFLDSVEIRVHVDSKIISTGAIK